MSANVMERLNCTTALSHQQDVEFANLDGAIKRKIVVTKKRLDSPNTVPVSGKNTVCLFAPILCTQKTLAFQAKNHVNTFPPCPTLSGCRFDRATRKPYQLKLPKRDRRRVCRGEYPS